MGKTIKPLGSRKPPEPSESPAGVDEWMRKVMPDLQPIVAELDASIRDSIPNLRYAVKWSKAHYGAPDLGWVIEMVAYHVSVNIVFYAGANFDDPPPLGTTGQTRYVKIRSLEEVRTPEVQRWIEQAGSFPGWSW